MTIPITVDGEHYKSLTEFAKARGVTPQAASKALKGGRLDTLGIGLPMVFYKGKWYITQAEAGRENGVTRQAVSIHLRRTNDAKR